MSKVWIVTEGWYSAYSIVAAFSTKKKAEAFIAEHPKSVWGAGTWDYRIEEYPLDAWGEFRQHRHWYLEFHDDGSTIREGHGPREMTRFDGEQRYPDVKHRKSCWKGGPNQYEPCWGAYVIAEDEEHAIKVAAELVAMKKARKAGIA